MKIKSNLYCITDKYNKPDFRYVFEDINDAKKKAKLIKNSTRGETIFLSQAKRDFFVSGVKRTFINPYKKISIKRGCWTGLKVKRLTLIDTIEPKKIFKKVIIAKNNQYSFSKEYNTNTVFQKPSIQLPTFNNPFAGFSWENSFLRTKTFTTGFATLCFITMLGIFAINQSTTRAIANQLIDTQRQSTEKAVATQIKVLGAKKEAANNNFDDELNSFVLNTLKDFDNIKQEDFENEIRKIVAGSPMEKMVPYIAQQDRTVAAFLVGIAKKESDFGRHVPVLNGNDCYNYWGYRGIRSRMGTGGHTCFNDPEDAINTVAGRLKDLVKADVNTPQDMVIWKCGSACGGDSGAQKWINDVSIYFRKIQNKENSQNS